MVRKYRYVGSKMGVRVYRAKGGFLKTYRPKTGTVHYWDKRGKLVK